MTIKLSTANIMKVVDKQRNLANLNSRQNSGYFAFTTANAPARALVSMSK